MPTVPSMMDPSQVDNPQGLLTDSNIKPEHLLMAASTMHSMGRLIDGGEQQSLAFGGKGGIRLPHRAKPAAGRHR